ncbi:MAG: PEGA domain-containing protein [Alistipes sp.]|nr:PEGA domain-containing protein [Alistipes sp.]
MKRLLALLSILFVSFSVAAQAEKSIVIDQKSFRPVQVDMLTGVGVDEIMVDSSRRPCARIKMKINRMTRAEIDQIEVKIATNNQLTKCRTADYDTGLIIEMTAKAQSRFYLYHPEFGESNEVSLNLEPNKEYYIEAYLNQSFSIVVNSNVAGADVYLDNNYKGQTNNNLSLTIAEVMVGDHTLRLEYGNQRYEQKIAVNKSNIFFRQNVNVEASKPQFVVFVVEPKSAVVLIDGKLYTPQDGVVTTVLESGGYSYSISAKDYHDATGTFTVAGAKVEKSINLDPAYGWLEVKSSQLEGAAVFVDNQLIGTAPVKSGKLSSGEHTVKIVKELYDAHTAVVTISDNKITSYNPTLSADFANVTINAFNGAEIWVNGEKKGTTKWSGRLATGAYIFEARKAGHRTTTLAKSISATPAYQVYNLEAPTAIMGGVVVTTTPAMADVAVDGKLVGRTPISLDNLIIGQHTITITKEGYSTHTEQITVVQDKSVNLDIVLHKGTKGPYKVGDFYDVDGVKGVVMEVDKTGYRGEIAVLTSTVTTADVKPYKVGDIVTINGVKGVVFEVGEDGYSGKAVSVAQSKSKLIHSTKTTHPASAWCMALGDSWYLPTKDELATIYKNKATIDKRLSTKLGSNLYWSSNQDRYVNTSYNAYVVGMGHGQAIWRNLNDCNYVRAVASFSKSVELREFNNLPQTCSPYKVGDFYNENGKQGVVFYVDKSGRNGGIVSLTESKESLPSKLSSWCQSLGAGWELPSSSALKLLAVKGTVKDAINTTLKTYGVEIGSGYYAGSGRKGYVSSEEYKNYECGNNSIFRARAVCRFGDQIETTQGPYAVGDYYCENGKQGVVFEVSADGMHGKIVYLTKIFDNDYWLRPKSKMKFVGATNEDDGEMNMQIIQGVEGWRTSYPLFAACGALGSGWYLPAINELKRIWMHRDKINVAIESRNILDNREYKYQTVKAEEFYGSSTEVDKKSFKYWATYREGWVGSGKKNKYSFYEILPVAKF